MRDEWKSTQALQDGHYSGEQYVIIIGTAKMQRLSANSLDLTMEVNYEIMSQMTVHFYIPKQELNTKLCIGQHLVKVLLLIQYILNEHTALVGK